MYSFYGGQKGQDFRISRVFSNRSEDLLQDLQARWYSPVNVGDYVFINYGDISELNQLIKNQQGQTIEIESSYNKNLNIDLLNCGKSYTNSIWQKIYVDEKKDISPDFPNSEENVFIFINFENNDKNSNEREDGTRYIITTNSQGEQYEQEVDIEGNWLNDVGQIIRFAQTPGFSLIETSDIYTEEHYGFGYRLIACVTGQTPRIQVFHQAINIEDGDPYVTYNLTNPDKPEIKFYLQKSQTITEAYTTILSPTQNPNVELYTSDVNINGNRVKASLTKPVIDFQLPRAVKYFSGLLFGGGSLSSYHYNYTTAETLEFNYYESEMSKEEVSIISCLSNLLEQAFNESINVEEGKFSFTTFKDYIYNNIDTPEFNTAKHYYLKDISLQEYLDVEKNSEVYEDMIPWGSYGFYKNYSKKEYPTLRQYCNHVKASLDNIIDKIRICISNNKIEIEYFDSYWSFLGVNKKEFLSYYEEEQLNYLKNFLDGYVEQNNLFLIANIFKFYTPLVNIRKLLFSINQDNLVDFNYIQDELQYVKRVLNQLYYLKLHFSYLKRQALSGDIYIHTPSGRLYQFMPPVENVNNLRVRYIGVLTAPAPEVTSKKTTAFIQSEDGYVENSIGVKNNLLVNESELGYREKYEFTLPNQPILKASVNPVNNRAIASVEKTILDLDSLNYEFSLPKSVKIFTSNDLERFDVLNKIPILKQEKDVEPYDIYIHTTHDLKDIYRGYVYMYLNGTWLQQGSILGPIGVPEPINVINIKATYDQPISTITPAKEKQKNIVVYNNMNSGTNTSTYSTINLSSYNYTQAQFAKGEVFLYGTITNLQNGEPVATEKTWTYGTDYTYNATSKLITLTKSIIAMGITVRLGYEEGDIAPYTYWVNINRLDNMEELMSTIASSDEDFSYPSGSHGQIILIKIFEGLSKGSDLSQSDNYWGQYNNEQNKWYLTLITSQGSYLSDSKIENENQAKSMTYSAHYINNIAPEWNVSNYY